MSEISQTELVSDEELDQMIWKLERDGGMTPKLLSLMKELREVRRAAAQPVAYRKFIKDDFNSLLDRYEYFDFQGRSGSREPLYAAPSAPHGSNAAISGRTLRDGLAAIRNSGIAIDAEKIMAERATLNEPTCWCRTCRPVTMNDMRFVVCPECGNKRCPHANDHNNACTGSNEPGQIGSAYPAAPKEVKGE